ncbi:MAG TPA: chemoreceptor glutamine deamidase CheD [Rhodopseudomonas sp.]|uniref:chemoreceptor glutamine deamidase CheD n=1 Tax=Rhodopseudomonas sp. TaxID=1078 RepID=UPI002EDB11A5
MTGRHHHRQRRATHDAAIADHGVNSRRYRDPRFEEIAVKVFPGEHHVTASNEMLVTILGSCVSACIRDPLIGVGGMNHFMLPESNGGAWDGVSSSMRYGNVAMERLINDILSRGGARERLEVKVFGGGNVMKSSANIGHRNAEFVEDYLCAENLKITAAHLRGTLPRRIHYFPATGKVLLLELRHAEEQAVFSSEANYKSKVQSDPVAGSVELF